MEIKTEIKSLLQEINEICIEENRDPKEIIVIAASKKQSVLSIKKAFLNGITNFGENFLQEAERKISAIGPGPIWHFIGSIQSNKAKKIAKLFNWVHTIDRIKVADKLNQYRHSDRGKLNICVQINLDYEVNKSGIPLEEAKDFVCELMNFQMLKVRGLMTIPQPTKNFDIQRSRFAKIRLEFEELREAYPHLDTLSMGMSNDFKAAVREGTTMIRIGENIFGTRR